MEVIRKGKSRIVECDKCESLIKYQLSDIKSEQTHMNEYNNYIICPECNNKIISPESRNVKEVKEIKAVDTEEIKRDLKILQDSVFNLSMIAIENYNTNIGVIVATIELKLRNIIHRIDEDDYKK